VAPLLPGSMRNDQKLRFKKEQMSLNDYQVKQVKNTCEISFIYNSQSFLLRQ
jgi:hypothetical protein